MENTRTRWEHLYVTIVEWDFILTLTGRSTVKFVRPTQQVSSRAAAIWHRVSVTLATPGCATRQLGAMPVSPDRLNQSSAVPLALSVQGPTFSKRVGLLLALHAWITLTARLGAGNMLIVSVIQGMTTHREWI